MSGPPPPLDCEAVTDRLADWVFVRTRSDAKLRAEVLALRHRLRVLER